MQAGIGRRKFPDVTLGERGFSQVVRCEISVRKICSRILICEKTIHRFFPFFPCVADNAKVISPMLGHLKGCSKSYEPSLSYLLGPSFLTIVKHWVRHGLAVSASSFESSFSILVPNAFSTTFVAHGFVGNRFQNRVAHTPGPSLPPEHSPPDRFHRVW